MLCYFLMIAASAKKAVKTTIISNTTSNMTAKATVAKTLGIENISTLRHVVNFFGGSVKYGDPGIKTPQNEVRHAP
jgi:hypothetical protein